MTRCNASTLLLSALLCVCCGATGCADRESSRDSNVSNTDVDTGNESDRVELRVPNDNEIRPISLSGRKGGTNFGGGADRLNVSQKMETVLEALNPLQVLVGEWRGVTQRSIDGAVSVEEPKWQRDFQTDKQQPALVVTSKTSPYFQEGRLTYLIDSNEYQFTARDRHGNERVYRGTFSEPVRNVLGDDEHLQRTFKLQLNQIFPSDGNKLRQIVFNQQENNRYLLEVYHKRGSILLRYDTVANQRQGTSFARNPNESRERECLISGGLGTMTVSYRGQSYSVCCSGCRDAFNEHPQTWIARYNKRNKK